MEKIHLTNPRAFLKACSKELFLLSLLFSFCFPGKAQTPAPPPGTYSTSWLGNTYLDNNRKEVVTEELNSICLSPNGKLFSAGYAEAFGGGASYSATDGSFAGRYQNTNSGFGDPLSVVAADSNYVYYGAGIGILRAAHGGQNGGYEVFLGDANVQGVYYKSGKLYVSDYSNGKIRVVNTSTMTEERSWSCDKPTRLTVDNNGNVWVVIYSTTSIQPPTEGPMWWGEKVVSFSATGTPGPEITDFERPLSVAVDNSGLLLVGGLNEHSQIWKYKVSGTPSKAGTFGANGGIFSGTAGAFTNTAKLHWIKGIAVDASDNIYTGCTYGTFWGNAIEKWDASGSLQFRLFAGTSLDCAGIDPDNETEVYSKFHHYSLDYSKTTPGTEWSLKGFTVNRFKYPNDYRVDQNTDVGSRSLGAGAFRIGGKLFVARSSQEGYRWELYRQETATDGEVLVPSVVMGAGSDANNHFYNPTTKTWVDKPKKDNLYNQYWCIAKNGDLFTVADNPDMIIQYKYGGLDASSNPLWEEANAVVTPAPAEISDTRRIYYDSDEDVMYLGADVLDGDYGSFLKIKKFTHWSTGNRTAAYTINLPYNDTDYIADTGYGAATPNAMSVAGDYIFIAYGYGHVRIQDKANGSLVGTLVQEVNGWKGSAGQIDATYGLTAYKRSNGEYVLLFENAAWANIQLYRWTPPAYVASAEDSLLVINPYANNTAFEFGKDIDLSISFNDADNSIGKVEFYLNDTLVYDTTAANGGFYNYTLKNPTPGSYAFYAKSFDKEKVTVHFSDTVNFKSKEKPIFPDLIVTDIQWTPDNLSVGDSVKFEVTVKNIGEAATRDSVIIGGVFSVDGEGVAYTDYDSQSLAPGDSVTLHMTGGWSPSAIWLSTAGRHSVSFLVDDVNRIAESNEDNNATYVEQLCVQGGPLYVNITSPGDSTKIVVGSDLTMTTNAYHCGTSIAKVEFFNGNDKLGEALAEPYNFTWVKPAVGDYQLIAKATDLNGATGADTIHFRVVPIPSYGIVREQWDNIPGTSVDQLTGSANYPQHPSSTSTLYDLFEGPKDTGDNYAARYHGYITAPQTGKYLFWIASDDNSELWLSTDTDTSNKKMIAQVADYTDSRQWDKYPEQKSDSIYLVAGQRYYVEVLHKEGEGGDNLAVKWSLPDGTEEAPIPASRIVPALSTAKTIVLSLGSAAGATNDEVTIPVRVQHFKDLVSAQGTLAWNAQVAAYVGVKDFGLPGLSAANFGKKDAKDGKLVFSWFDARLTPNSLPDSAVLFSIRLKLTGPQGYSTALVFEEAPLKLELVGSDGQAVEANTTAGSIRILSSVSIVGSIRTPTGLPVKAVKVTLMGGNQSKETTTTADGWFSFTAAAGSPYTLTPSKHTDSTASNGLSTLDLILIQRHILGIQPLPSPYAIIAADVNGSGTITTQDIVAIQSVILQNAWHYPGNRLWTFLPGNYSFADPSNPFPYDSTQTYAPADTASQDFLGIKLGDVNGTWSSTGGRIATDYVHLDLNDLAAQTGTEVEIPVKVNGFNGLSGYQFTFNWDPKVLQFAGVNEPRVQASYNVNRISTGKLSTVWFDPAGGSLSLPDGETLLKMKFKVVGTAHSQSSLSITSSLTESVAYNDGLAEMKIISAPKQFYVGNAGELGTFGYELLQNQPNPFDASTAIRFTLPQEEQVVIAVYNTLGQVVRTFTGAYPAGGHRLSWNGDSDGGGKVAPGTYFYRMQVGKFTAVKKMVVL